MPRPLRIEFVNAWYHVMNRGANHQNIFKSNAHRYLFYMILNEIVDQFQVEIHAYCLMDNHYHLIIKTPYANLSRAMQYLDGIYTQRFNRSVGRDGPLFRGRYKAILIDSDEYLLQVSRYIHLNPVVANVCIDPLEFRWSSFRSYVKEKLSISWLNTSHILSQLASPSLRRAYFDYVIEGIDEETKRFYNKKHLSTIYGSDSFIKAHLNKLEVAYVPFVLTDINRTKPLPSKETILNLVKAYFQISELKLFDSTPGRLNVSRLAAIYLLRKFGHVTHKEISELFNIKSTSVSSLIGRIKKFIKQDSVFAHYIHEISKKLIC